MRSRPMRWYGPGVSPLRPGAIVATFLACASVLSLGCRAKSRPDTRPYSEAQRRLLQSADPEERVRVIEKFLAGPAEEGKTYVSLLEEGALVAETELNDPDRAESLYRLALTESRGSRRSRLVELSYLEWLGKHRDAAFPAAVDRLQEGEPLEAWDHLRISDAALAASLWELAELHAQQALELQDTADIGGFALLNIGWAEANLGRPEQALRSFQSADRLLPRHFAGLSPSPLDLYWGQTHLLMGNDDAAIDRLLPEVVFRGNEGALRALELAFEREHGSAAGLEGALSAYQQEHAPPAPDFTLADYEGVSHRFSDLVRGKAAVLVFWFPT